MLTNLHVKNIALIDEVDIEFSKGLNILTGETGAGKSIILGAVNLALGKKMSSGIIGKFGNYALVELVFTVEGGAILKELAKHDIICEDHQLIISRKIMEGRSISKINSETCTTAQMKYIASLLLDIHGQHEHQKLLSQDHQLAILDEFAGATLQAIKEKTASSYEVYRKLKDELSEYQLDGEQRRRELSFVEFEIEEIEKAGLKPDEDLLLEKQHRKLSNSKKIAETLQSVHELTGSESRNQAGELVGIAIREMSSVKEYDENLSSLYMMLLDVESMLGDYNRGISDYLSELVFSEAEFQEMDQRLDLINALKAKYGHSIEEVLKYQEAQMRKQEQLNNFEEKKAQLAKQLLAQEEELAGLSRQLSDARKTTARLFEEQLLHSLQDLNFPDVDFAIVFTELNKFSKNGKDSIQFLISTNLGEVKKPLGKVVSGGELSRIMLAVKTLIADTEETQTQIFDEIDSGISGRTAQKVAEKMELIGRRRQVLCITHLPQIAAMSDAHYEIKKSINENITTTQIYHLNNEESIEEIARILGGAKITDSVRINAKEMKELARVHKNTRVK